MKDIPAFPRSIYSLNGAIDSQSMSVGYGMDLRDYFASAFLANKWCACENVEDTAKNAYKVADAMMKAREV